MKEITFFKIFRSSKSILPVIFLFSILLLFPFNFYGQVGKIDKLEQSQNGKIGAVLTTTQWVTGNVNGQKAHYAEGMAIPYRLSISDLTPGITYTVTIGYDTQKDFKHALDFLVSYDYYGTHGTFDHGTEIIDPLLGTGISPASKGTPVLIPTPNSDQSSVTGQPTAFHAALPAEDKQMNIWNGEFVSIDYLPFSQDPLGDGTTSSRLTVEFEVNPGESKVVIAWGGHIAGAYIGEPEFWGEGNSASAINGSPYHMFVDSCDEALLSGCGNKEVQLSADAVFPPPLCELGDPVEVCAGAPNRTYTAQITNGDNPVYVWNLVNDVTGDTNAQIVSGQGTDAVTVDPGDGAGTYRLDLKITNQNTLFHECSVITTVNANPVVANKSVCVGSTVDFGPSGTYQSDDTSVATINNDGVATGVKAGTATITYTDANGCSGTATIT
ncbi:Ig-like domain-containing protein, partial [Gramella sp. KN1008]|uniref:Ig-like domain-containing protein n=1 Tax=Gramella sp. KN1008 TaxID=2529298 RepID=UPI001A947FDE